MKKQILTGFLTVCILAVLRACAAESEVNEVLQPKPYYGIIAQRVARLLPQQHLSQAPFNDEISQKAWTNLITQYDFDHSVFLQSDLDGFAPMQMQIDDALKAGDVSFVFDVHRCFVRRMQERYTFVTNVIAGGFDFTVPETYAWKRKDAPWPKTVEEQNELWRKRIKNEILAQTLSRELDAIAASNALARAASETNRVAEVKDEPAVTNATSVLTPAENVAKRYRQYLSVFRETDEETVLQRYLTAACMAYDPHSDYMSPMSKEDFDISMNLSLCGVGAVLRSDDGAVKIMEVMPGGPIDRDKRINKGDKIIAVGQGDEPLEDIMHRPLNKVVRKIRGPKGSKVVLEVIPVSDPSGVTTRRIDLIRDEIKMEEQAATGYVQRVTLNGVAKNFGIVKLPTFYGTMDKRPGDPDYRSCTQDVAQEIAAFNTQDVEGMILDLRNNGGGSLREAILLTGLFVRSGPVVQVREPYRISVQPLPVFDPELAFRKPLIVMINRASASASEIVAGALQDYGRAIIVGDTLSHGKGTVQTVLSMGNEKYGSLKVTTASFYRITGASTQIKGVASDIVLPSILEELELGEDKLPGALPWTQVQPASYVPVWDMTKYVPMLCAKSLERRATNTRYAKHVKLVHGMRELSDRKTLPLEITARRVQMEEEREMRALEDREFGVSADEDDLTSSKKKTEDDVVLDETLNILYDLTVLTNGAEVPMETDGDLRMRMLRFFGKEL